MDHETKTNILGLLEEEISRYLEPLGEPPYRALQIFSFVHRHGAQSFDEMTNLPKWLRAWLDERFCISRLEPKQVLLSKDGSSKLIFEVDGEQFTSVLMPEDDRVTLCVSSQVGCRMGCKFCRTGQMRFKRNLRRDEILSQVIAGSKLLEEGRRITNVVFMGMGEPLDNLENVEPAIKVISHREGFRVAPRKVTVSTVGLLPELNRFVEAQTKSSIAISLCSPKDSVRSKFVPVAKKYPLQALVSTLKGLRLPYGHRFTIEYLMIEGVGDSIEDAKELSRLLAHFPAKVNLIPFNPWEGCAFRRPEQAKIQRFYEYLKSKNHIVTIRESRGQDIGAACGQLGDEK